MPTTGNSSRAPRQELAAMVLSIAHDMAKSLLRVEDSLGRLRQQISAAAAGADSVRHLDACMRELRRRVQDLSRMARKGDLSHHPRRFELGPLVAESLFEQRPLLEKRGVTVQVVGTLAECWGDPDRIKQAVNHLLRSAVLRGCDAARPQITISSPRTADATGNAVAALRIHANGPNDPTGPRPFGDDDPGMAIVRQVCQMHGGFAQTDLGSRHGAAMVLFLPPERSDAVAEACRPRHKVQVMRRWRLDAEGHRQLAAASGRAALPQRPHYRPTP